MTTKELFEANDMVKALGLKFDPLDPLHLDIAFMTEDSIRFAAESEKRKRRERARVRRDRAASLMNLCWCGRFASFRG